MNTLNEVLPAALKLTTEERTALACELLDSLDTDASTEEATEAWNREILARSDAFHAGQAHVADWRRVLADIREELSPKSSDCLVIEPRP